MKKNCLCIILVILCLTALAQGDGLILHFSAEKPGVDLSRSKQHGRWNDISQVPGIPGISDSAFYFNGTSSRIEVPPYPALNDLKSLSLTLWFKNDLLLSANSLMFLFNRPIVPASHNAQALMLELWLANMRFLLANGKATFAVLQPSKKQIFEQNVWYHIACVYDADKRESRLYINGLLSNRDTVPIEVRFGVEGSLYFGVRYREEQYTGPFKGGMCDIRLYDRALSDNEVSTLTKGFKFEKPDIDYPPIQRLGAGRYVVKSVDSTGMLNPNWEIVEVSAAEPFWKKGWFLAACIVGTFLLTFGAVYLYNRGMRQEQLFEFEKARTLERERFRIAREMHDDIGSGLSAINLLTEIALNKSKDPHLAAEIERIAAASRDVHGRIQDIIWAISLQNDTLTSLLQYLRRFAADYLTSSGMVFHFHVPDYFPSQIIPGERRRAIFLAFKEALHNVAKHAHATQINITFEISGQYLTIQILDNGKGFDPPSASKSGNGLTNMQKRMEDVGGEFRIESDSNGTLVTFRLPF